MKYLNTNFTSKWAGRRQIMSNFPLLNLSKVIDFNKAWYSCTSVVEFPLLDLSNGINFNHAWRNCVSLNEFPLMNLSNGIYFDHTWHNCSSFTEFPLLNLSNGISFVGAWEHCSYLFEFPQLNLSNGCDFSDAWHSCYDLTYFPPNMFDNLPKVIADECFYNTWKGCSLNSQSIENILVSIDKRQIINKKENTITIGAEPISNYWTEKTTNAIKSLQNKNWTIIISDEKLRKL